MRPLIGLTPQQAQLAWERAVEKARGRRVTARLVKSAVKELQSGDKPTAVAPRVRQPKVDHRQVIDAAIGQLLLLLSQKASYEKLTEQVEALHGHFGRLFATANGKE